MGRQRMSEQPAYQRAEAALRAVLPRSASVRVAARDSGDRHAVRRLRRLHWAGMLSHAVALIALLASIPYLNLFPR